jgi:hypothetical protein
MVGRKRIFFVQPFGAEDDIRKYLIFAVKIWIY